MCRSRLRHLLHDHLDPVGLPDPVLLGLQHGGPPTMLWAGSRGVLVLLAGLWMGEICSAFRRPRLLLGGQASPATAPHLVVVHRLVQPPRPGRRHRRHQLRLRLLDRGLPLSVHQQGYSLSPGHLIAILAIVLYPGPLNNSASAGGVLNDARSGGTSSACSPSWSSCWWRPSPAPTVGRVPVRERPAGTPLPDCRLLAALLHLLRAAERVVHVHRLRRLGPRDQRPSSRTSPAPRASSTRSGSRWCSGSSCCSGEHRHSYPLPDHDRGQVYKGYSDIALAVVPWATHLRVRRRTHRR